MLSTINQVCYLIENHADPRSHHYIQLIPLVIRLQRGTSLVHIKAPSRLDLSTPGSPPKHPKP